MKLTYLRANAVRKRAHDLGHTVSKDFLEHLDSWIDGKIHAASRVHNGSSKRLNRTVAAFVLKSIIIIFFVGLASAPPPAACAPPVGIPAGGRMVPVDLIVDAIYWSEGGTKAHTPFGIETVPCQGYEDCRKIASNTVKNQYRRWRDSQANLGHSYNDDYLTSLAKRYCPPNWRVWLKNVRWFIDNPKAVV